MPQISPLDRLYASGRIMGDDYLAGRRYGFLAQHRDSHAGCRQRFAAARAALDRNATLSLQMVDLLILVGERPRSDRGLDAAIDGLGTLDAHFRATWPDYSWPPTERPAGQPEAA